MKIKNLIEKVKKNKICIRGIIFFRIYYLFLILILIVFSSFSIYDKANRVICWSKYENAIGVSSQIVIAIITLAISIISIAISLQNEDFFGVKITKLYALRVDKHFSIVSIILISIVLCILNLFFYMAGLFLATIGVWIVSLLFLLQVVFTEVPIMSKQEDALLCVLKNNLIFCYLNKVEASKDLKDSLRYLLYTKNFKEVYRFLQDNNDQEYNKYAFVKLLEFQKDLAFTLSGYNDNEQRVIGSSLLENVSDVLLHKIPASDEIYSEVHRSKYLLTTVLFRIYKLSSVHKPLLYRIGGWIQYISFTSSEDTQKEDLISDIIIIMVAETVKAGDFDVLKEIRQELSNLSFCLDCDTPALTVFSVLSMYLYYLCYADPDVPSSLKEQVISFINEGNDGTLIEERTKIISWKNLFSEVSSNFNVNYSQFIDLASRNSDTMEYYLFGEMVKIVVLGLQFYSCWYLANFLNSQQYTSDSLSSLLSKYKDIKPQLRYFGDKCITEDQKFIPTDRMNEIVGFYSNESEHFLPFKFYEEHDHSLFTVVNELKYEELRNDSKQAANIDSNAFATTIQARIEAAIKEEWGYDPQLSVDTPTLYNSVILEKMPEAVNFEDAVINYCIDSVFANIKASVKKSVIYKTECFEDDIQKILKNQPKYITVQADQIIPYFYIKNQKLKSDFIKACEMMEKFKSKILGASAMVLADGFRFNCQVEKVELRELSEEEVVKQIEKHQRADGQFVFEGVFLPREEIVKLIKAKCSVLTIAIKSHVMSSEDRVFELKPFMKNPSV